MTRAQQAALVALTLSFLLGGLALAEVLVWRHAPTWASVAEGYFALGWLCALGACYVSFRAGRVVRRRKAAEVRGQIVRLTAAVDALRRRPTR